MEIRLAAEMQIESIVDGEGLRAVIWTQGCPHNCFGCHNPSTHDIEEGFFKDIEELKLEIKNLEYHDGITLSGGDPMMQVEECLEIAKYCKELGLNVWCYTGYTFEFLMILSKSNNKIMELLKNIDILVDGKFILEERSLDLKFRGSRNQRILDVKKSLEQKKSIIVSKYLEEKRNNFIIPKEEYVFI